jgi:hypothetical protein
MALASASATGILACSALVSRFCASVAVFNALTVPSIVDAL